MEKIINIINTIAISLLVLGGINFILMGIFDLDIIASLGVGSVLARGTYIFTGLSFLWIIFLIFIRRR
jgi:hypothetical protein